jgi:hypothetical protein
LRGEMQMLLLQYCTACQKENMYERHYRKEGRQEIRRETLHEENAAGGRQVDETLEEKR